MPKRKGGGYRAPKHYLPRDAKPSKHRPGGAGGAGRFDRDRRDASDGIDGSAPGTGLGTARDRGRPAPARDARDTPRRDKRGTPRRDERGTPRNVESRNVRSDGPRDGTTEGRLRVGNVVGQPSPRRGRPDDVVPERLEATAITPELAEGVTFEDLGFGVRIVEALASLGATAPFPIQVATIPDALAGRDVLARGRTGSGKTIAFGSAIVERLLVTRPREERGKRVVGRPPRGLIIAPTRELALQIDRTVRPIARSVGLFTTQVYGGVPQQRQVGGLRRGVDIVIGTPGRIEDLHRQGHLDLSSIEVTVLDEADLMCDLGFLDSMQRILRIVRRGGQRMLFSATLDAAVRSLVAEFLVHPAVHEVAGEASDHADIEHRVLVVERGDRDAVLRQLAAAGGRVLVFARTKLGAEQLAQRLDDGGVPAIALHGDLSQERRSRNLEKFANGRADVLVATDVAARGIHVDDIDLVIQADAPDEYKTYLHRAGRTGRAGRRGTVVTLIPPNRQRRMAELLGRAEVDAPVVPARAGGRELDEFAR
ncbi:hypothetical protein GCM10011490_15240 [Pseudoclavibacter endophyticus]|uniref:DEAD/DEAH box helicase n=1 Tax=Pseudoclavibacter endophyticus TaxID=1778590 RepID=A0A6H9WRZ2_9MICO|nr:DEAD/DEAH box helicase [Pseudoclavibacter endophyticus]KAB1649090.1 DEAD/DEAH box helicase [Pseudoclavibacter endophyticus]GGA65540.1 hypothetical protein GCM10011490_15240 [Pseudoclavibacter endophyticus]